MCYIASEHPNLYKKALEGIDRALKDVLEERDKIATISMEALSEVPTAEKVVTPVCPILILDPHVSQTVGRKPKEDDKKKKKQSNDRWKRPIEVALKKRRRNCSLGKSQEHDKRSCPKNPNRQHKTRSEPVVAAELVED
ncbi:hypothetical protein FRX31_005096 [Thalictrum thalictroides]|uniref:Uncharacterized protein n=1 Tax=Thalictrum thalictroides TaxID=46969 RepID=A0A7J6X8J2_THATH|nr:hypothetical protein FRX31_005096 [Thalictrum thalictroides]